MDMNPWERRQRMERIRRRKAQGLQDRYLYGYTFANDNGGNPVMAKAHAYVDHWPQAFKRNIGLLLFGDVGTGKSFAAGCIANALLDRDVPVLMTNFPTILARLCGTFGEDRTDFLDSLGDYDLLIIDDLGAERNTEYAMEQMFSIIDSRYRCNKPLIVTTNLKLDELKRPPDLAHARIYDRILERCAPILFAGKNFREDNAASTKTAARSIVSYDHSKIESALCRERNLMENENMNMIPAVDTVSATAPEDTTAQENPPALIKKVGGMTYIVRVHFSTTSKETFSDKVKRLLRNEVRQLMEQEAAGE